MEELKEKIMDSLHNEIEDVEGYMDTAKMAEESDHRHLAGMLRDIAHDEYTHAMLLHNALGFHGSVPADIESEWSELKRTYSKM